MSTTFESLEQAFFETGEALCRLHGARDTAERTALRRESPSEIARDLVRLEAASAPEANDGARPLLVGAALVSCVCTAVTLVLSLA